MPYPLHHVEDAEFVAALTSGDERLLSQLADRLITVSVKYLTGWGATRDEAEEIFWISIEALWEKGRKGFPPGFNFFAFYLQICKHQLYNLNRRKKNQGIRVTIDALTVLKDPEPNILEILHLVEFRTEMKRHLNILGEPCRQLLLYWADGLSFEEIAQKLEYKNADTARQQKFKCLERLKKIIGDGLKG